MRTIKEIDEVAWVMKICAGLQLLLIVILCLWQPNEPWIVAVVFSLFSMIHCAYVVISGNKTKETIKQIRKTDKKIRQYEIDS